MLHQNPDQFNNSKQNVDDLQGRKLNGTRYWTDGGCTIICTIKFHTVRTVPKANAKKSKFL